MIDHGTELMHDQQYCGEEQQWEQGIAGHPSSPSASVLPWHHTEQREPHALLLWKDHCPWPAVPAPSTHCTPGVLRWPRTDGLDGDRATVEPTNRCAASNRKRILMLFFLPKIMCLC